MTAGHHPLGGRHDFRSERHRVARPGASAQPEGAGHPLLVRGQVRLVGGEAGRALAAAQGRALAALLATLGQTEVGQGEEVSP